MIYLQTNSYNLDIAKVFGVSTSVFLTCLNTEYERQIRDKALNANNTMAMSRAEIYARTALDDDKQKDVELALTECGVITVKPLQNVPNKNYYILNEEQLTKIMQSNNPSEIIGEERSKQFIKPTRVEPTSKRKTHIISLKKKINMEDPIIQQYFVDWIDAVYTNPKGFLSPSGVVIAQQELLAYSLDQAKQIAILKIAIKGGMRDITWAIEQYEKQAGVGTRNFAKYEDIKADISTMAEDETF